MCDRWFEQGVVLNSENRVCCVDCGHDISRMFQLLSRADPGLGLTLLGKGRKPPSIPEADPAPNVYLKMYH